MIAIVLGVPIKDRPPTIAKPRRPLLEYPDNA